MKMLRVTLRCHHGEGATAEAKPTARVRIAPPDSPGAWRQESIAKWVTRKQEPWLVGLPQ
jgi:hypothetical protein